MRVVNAAPLGKVSRHLDVAGAQPLTDQLDVLGAIVIVDDGGMGQLDLRAYQHAIGSREQTHVDAIGDAPVDDRLPIDRQRIGAKLRVGGKKIAELVEFRIAQPRQSHMRREFALLRFEPDTDQRLLDLPNRMSEPVEWKSFNRRLAPFLRPVQIDDLLRITNQGC